MAVGLCNFPTISVQDLPSLAHYAEDLGFRELWSGEVSSGDAFTPLAAVAMTTTQLRLGAGIVSVFTRPPALLAMTCASMQLLSNGRFCLGLGISTPAVVSGWMGQQFRKPITRLRETVKVLKSALSGQSVNFDGATLAVHSFRLDLGPITVPIMIGALEPKMYRLAGEIGDGILLTFVSPTSANELLKDFWRGVEQSGRRPGNVEVICRMWVCFDEDQRQLRQEMRAVVGTYSSFPAYKSLLRRQGFIEEADVIADGWRRNRGDGAAIGVSNAVLEHMAAWSVEDYVEKVRAFQDAGVTTLLLDIRTAVAPSDRLKQIARVLEAIAPR